MSEKFDALKMEEEFFEDTALVGIATALPAYKLCWMLNEFFEIDFMCEPEMTCPFVKNNLVYHLPVFQYLLPNCSHRFILYKLKYFQVSMLPEIAQIDYLWLIQTATHKRDAQDIKDGLRKIPEITLSQVLELEDIKNIKNLLV